MAVSLAATATRGAVVGRRATSLGSSSRRTVNVNVRAASSMSTLYDFEVKGLSAGTRDAPTEGAAIDLSAYKGKVVMVQNVATI